jgi:3D (Asp-Asp-Asp) domain-containing protein
MIAAALLSAVLAASWEPLEVVATAYCPCTYCCGHRAAGVTADGTRTKDEPYGVATGSTTALPYGTVVWIPASSGYLSNQLPADEQRQFTVDDTGGLLRSNTRATGVVHIDLRFRHHGNARRFGVKRITIYVWKDDQ